MKAEASDENSSNVEAFGGFCNHFPRSSSTSRRIRRNWRRLAWGGRPLRLGESGGTGGGWRGGLPWCGAASLAVKAGLRRWTETTSTLLPTWSWKVLRERDKTL